MTDTRDDRRLKKEIVDENGVRHTVDDILTNPQTDQLPNEDTHERLPDDKG